MKGVHFSDAMAQAVFEGRKTQTRRLHDKPRFKVGDVVYVKEAWGIYQGYAVYRANRLLVHGIEWHPSLFMWESAARSKVRITSVKTERLQDISLADAVAEGMEDVAATDPDTASKFSIPGPQYRFAHLWDSINKKPGTRWADNPQVTVYEFVLERTKENE